MPQPLRPGPVLLTGGAGYIGSHTFVALHAAGFEPVILDNFANSQPAVLDRLERITGSQPLLERHGRVAPDVACASREEDSCRFVRTLSHRAPI